MKRSRFTDEQICFALKMADTGTKVSEVCRKMGISKWPYQKLKPIERKLARLRSQAWDQVHLVL